MPRRATPFVENEYYHVYNRGVDKRTVFDDDDDFQRFLDSIRYFNQKQTIGSIVQFACGDKKVTEPLIEVVAYCLNPNHYHLIIKQVCERGIEKFMQRLGTGYSNYFNSKYERHGSLFQGKFKSKHVNSNDYLLRLSAYVNLNYVVHGLDECSARSSFNDYRGINRESSFCAMDIILSQFKNAKDYEAFARDTAEIIHDLRTRDAHFEDILFD